MIKLIALAALVLAQTPSRAEIIAASRDIIQKAHFCTFVTIASNGQPQARVVDPLAPDTNFTLWFATNPLTRKVGEIRKNPKATISCFDSASASYVTVLGTAAIVTDTESKRSHWKTDWDAIYPKGPAGADVVLVRLTPARLEISSESRGMKNEPKTWLPISIGFPR